MYIFPRSRIITILMINLPFLLKIPQQMRQDECLNILVDFTTLSKYESWLQMTCASHLTRATNSSFRHIWDFYHVRASCLLTRQHLRNYFAFSLLYQKEKNGFYWCIYSTSLRLKIKIFGLKRLYYITISFSPFFQSVTETYLIKLPYMVS